jgi:basic amino acid/polyamine antiporter, APA family
MIALSTLAVIVPYLFSIIAHFSIMKKQGNIPKLFLSLAGLGFVFWVISGSGWETIFYGLSFIFAGVIFYFITQAKRKV